MAAAPPPPCVSEADGVLDIVLLMKPPEATFCAAALCRINAKLRIGHAPNLEELESSVGRLSPSARLIAFSTSVVVPGPLLPVFGGGCFNFHPGPPEYPGNRPSAFACYHEASQFGVTFHRMISKVDAGEILDCARFPTTGRETAGALAIEAYQKLAALFLRNVTALAQLTTPIPGNGEHWTGTKTTLADYNALRSVARGTEQAELNRRLRAFSEVYSPINVD